MPENHLIIFARNPVFGRVKTRLAATIGAARAFAIYQRLVAQTIGVTQVLDCEKTVYFDDHIDGSEDWNDYRKAVQRGDDLGERMQFAFADCFKHGARRVAIIGTDCPGITALIINEAFAQLQHQDVAIGPAMDGGYYLLALNAPQPTLFQNIVWSTDTVFKATAAACRAQHLSYATLPLLSDIDEEKDLPPGWLPKL